MEPLMAQEIPQIAGMVKCCYCNKSGGTSLPSRSPTAPERCAHFCCEVVHFNIISWSYLRDGVRTDGLCPQDAKPGPSTHLASTPITGPEAQYLAEILL